MTHTQQINSVLADLKKVLLDKQKGYKTVGATAGAALGAGIGGTAGLIKTINKHRKGELDELDNMGKVKEYFKTIGTHGGIGLGAGALIGMGTGEAGRRWVIKDPMKDFKKDLINDIDPERILEAGTYMKNQAIQDLPTDNLVHGVKEKIKEMMSKKSAENTTIMSTQERAFTEGFLKRANEYGFDDLRALSLFKQSAIAAGPPPPIPPIKTITGLKRSGARVYGGAGAMLGSGVGAVGGALKGLISPDEEIDPRTGEKIQKGRLSSALNNAVSGGLIGGGVGAGVGMGVGAYRGAKLKPTLIAAANKAYAANPSKLNPTEVASGNIHHTNHDAFARHEQDAIRKYMENLRKRTAPVPPPTA